jgi:tetratricopeptide (TPR) repeat protein
MVDASKPDAAPVPPDRADADERDAKIDELLLKGLEHYFDGRYDEAINVWGRVLFLDRGHARARAYIERARSASAEQQRRSDELLHAGVAAFQQGDQSRARELLSTAAEHGASQDDVVGYLDRLRRLASAQEHRSAARRTTRAPRPIDPMADRRRPNAPVRALPIIGLVALAAAVIVFAASQDLLRPLVDARWTGARRETSLIVPADPLPIPRAAEISLGRARALFATGHLQDALVALETISPADPLAAESDRLRSEIQRALLGAAGLDVPPVDAGPGPSGGRGE